MTILIEALVKEGLITHAQIQEAEEKQRGAKIPLHELLIEMGYLREDDLMHVSSKVFKMPVVTLSKEELDLSLAHLVPYEHAKRLGVCPFRKRNNLLHVAMSDPVDVVAIDAVRDISGMDIEPLLSSKTEITKALEKLYQSDDSVYDLLKNVVQDEGVAVIGGHSAPNEYEDITSVQSDCSPAVRLVNLILGDAVKERASDIHLEPQEAHLRVRYRIDGQLRTITEISKKLSAPVISRVKVMAQLDIAETRKSQDGRIRISTRGRDIDLRVSVLPTYFGEKVVLRVLDSKQARVKLDTLGFEPVEYDSIKDSIIRPNGMILVTGPTGSGKTSTLYACLNSLKNEKKNIVTIEDPIEYLIEGITQTQIDPIKDVTFANGLRHLLRQDPDVILVGEIRDTETAQIAFKSSLTGHLVLSTLHTKNSIGSITRLRDLGLESYLIASSLIVVIAQRLTRLICTACKERTTPDEKLLDKLRELIRGFSLTDFYKGKGCGRCGFSGFYDRIGVFEILKITDSLRALISNNALESDLLKEARMHGFRTLQEAGMQKVLEGVTTLEEFATVIDVAQEEKKEAAALKGGAPTILIADDEKDISRVLSARLRQNGYTVIVACDGKEAVECTFRRKPDLVIMDVMMPVMDGVSATKILRSRLETARIPIMMLTAKSDKQSEIEGLDAGADDYIAKPFDSDKLLARIKMLLRRPK